MTGINSLIDDDKSLHACAVVCRIPGFPSCRPCRVVSSTCNAQSAASWPVVQLLVPQQLLLVLHGVRGTQRWRLEVAQQSVVEAALAL